MVQETSKRISQNIGQFLEMVRQILKSKCYIKFDVEQLEPESSLFKGDHALSPRKRIELLLGIEDETGVTISTDELNANSVGTVREIYSYISEKSKTCKC